MIEVCTVGGYNEVGKNCTAVRVDDEVIIFDLGLHMEIYVRYTDDEDVVDFSPKKLTSIGAVPDLAIIEDWKQKVVAIIPTHAHLDHIGAIPFLAGKYSAPVICTPYSKAVLSAILKDNDMRLRNDIIAVNPNASYTLSKNLTVEFIHVTHSVPQTVMVALHTKYGTVIYANDYKFDNTPTLGKAPNYERLRELGDKGVKCLIVDSLYSTSHTKTPSEAVAREMLKDVLLGVDSKDKAVIVSTFSSHLARIKTIIELGKKMNRSVILLGRSLGKYVLAGQDTNIIHFEGEAEIVRYREKVAKKLRKIKQQKGKYLIICTGHQGEPKSVLSRMVNGEYDFRLEKGDHVVFSCTVIPSEVNILNRHLVEDKLMKSGVRIFRDIHVSGHGAREDLRDLLGMVKPEHIIPSHGGPDRVEGAVQLATELGYKEGKTLHSMKDGKRLVL